MSKKPGGKGRFSARKKGEAVLRLLRGEDLDLLSREFGVPAARLSEWRETFLAVGGASLKSRAISPAGSRPYGVVRVVGEWQIARSSFHAARVWVRRRVQGIRAGKPRILRLMREAHLLAPSRAGRVLGPRHHDGTIIPERPDAMWGTDATTTWTTEEGQATVFVAVDHATHEGVGIHAAKVGTRFEALEPIRQAVKGRFGAFEAQVASGLQLRHDHGSPYRSDDFQREIRFLGIASSPAFVRAPEGNGCAEWFIRGIDSSGIPEVQEIYEIMRRAARTVRVTAARNA